MANALSQNLKHDLLKFRDMLFIEYQRKIFWSILLYILFIYAYKFTETHLHFPITTVTPGPIDLFLNFDLRWTPMYLSLFIFCGFGSLTIANKRDFYSYLYLFAGVFLTAIAIFYFFPTFIDRPTPIEPTYLYRQLIQFDLPYNAFPSLHASFCITTCFAFFQNSKPLHYKKFYRICIVLWALLILFSILKIKQHYLIDIIGGIANAIIWIWIVYFVIRKS